MLVLRCLMDEHYKYNNIKWSINHKGFSNVHNTYMRDPQVWWMKIQRIFLCICTCACSIYITSCWHFWLPSRNQGHVWKWMCTDWHQHRIIMCVKFGSVMQMLHTLYSLLCKFTCPLCIIMQLLWVSTYGQGHLFWGLQSWEMFCSSYVHLHNKDKHMGPHSYSQFAVDLYLPWK